MSCQQKMAHAAHTWKRWDGTKYVYENCPGVQ